MTEKILIVEGLPDDLERVRPRLELYFKNKRRSGGEIMGVKDYPEDKRKALLVYHEDGDMQKVLTKKNHQVHFKEPLGEIVLQVKLKEDVEDVKEDVRKVKPPVLPRPDKVKLTLLGNSVPRTEAKDCDVFEDTADSVNDETAKTGALSLLVRHSDEITKGICTMYFEQFVSEEPCLIKHGKNSWILKLSNQSDVEKVLAVEEHDFGISVEVYHDRVEEGKLDPRRFVLSGFGDSCKCSFVTLFIRSCTQGADHAWETLDDGDRIVVTFKQDIDAESFLNKCSSKLELEIAAGRLELTDSVLVQGDMSRIQEETLSLYFSSKRSKGGEIRSMIWVTQRKSVVISFEDCHVAHRVVEQKHHLGGVELTAQLFYSSLQKVLRGPTAVQPDLPTKVVLPLSSELLGFLNRDQGRKQELQTGLQKLHANVSINMEPPQIELQMTMEKESLGALRLGPAWERKVYREAQTLLEKYKEVQVAAALEVWERVESSCLGLNCLDASISYMSDGGKIAVVGTQAEVKTVVEKLEDILKDTNEELEMERDTIERKISLKSKEELDFVFDRISGKIGNLMLSKDEENLVVCLKGLKDKVISAEGHIKETQMNVEAKPLDLSAPLVKFMMSMDLKKFETDHIAQNHISAVFLLGDESIQILAERGDIQRAEDKLHEVIKEEVIGLSPDQVNVTKSEQWMQFFSELNRDLESSLNGQNVSISQLPAEIGICGLSSVVADVLSKIKGYLENKKPTTVDISLKSVQEAVFFESFMDLSAVLGLGVTIQACKTQGSPCLKVTAASEKINEAAEAVKTRVSEITTVKHVYSNAGESKVLEKNQVALKAKAKELQCMLCLLPQVTTAQSVPHILAPPLPVKPDLRSTVTVAGVSVILKKGDITKETVDVIVNSNNINLNLNSGVSGAILKAAGQSVVDECKTLGAQSAGGVVLTGGGNLGCKHIAQMVGPGNTTDITASVEKVFQLCESKQAASVSIPTIGTGRGGIDPKRSIEAMLRALENHASQTASSSIKRIIIVAFEQKVFDCMLDYIIKRNGETQCVKQPKTASPRPQSKLPSNQVMIHGVRVEVRRGDITTDSVRGIVNTTNSDISSTGGVSGAILKAAGSAVQQECQNIRPLKGDEAGVTSGGDLPCDFIIHMLGPHSATDAAVRVAKALERCEEKQITTVSFPAVGSGGGGLSGTDSVGAMLQGIRDHLSQRSSTVLKLIYIVMNQDKVLQDVLQGLDQWKSKVMDEDDTEDEDGDLSTTSEDGDEDDTEDEDANTTEAMIGPVKVKVFCGDITKENTDAIVSSTNTSLNLSSGVSGAILKAAGQTVVDECKRLGVQPSDGVVITKPGNLQAKQIIHMVGQSKEKDITSSMLKVLNMCEDKKIQSVSFPALGTGAGNLGALQVGNAMMQAVADFLLAFRKPLVTSIHIVIFQKQMMKDFEEVLKKYKKVIPCDPFTTRLLRSVGASLGLAAAKKTLQSLKDSRPSPSTSSAPTKAPLCLASATAAVLFPVMEVEVYASSPASLLQVKTLLDQQLSEECSSQDVSSSQLALLLEPEKEAILALSQKSQVRILVAASQDRLTISGKKDDVLASVIQVKDLLTRAKDRESRAGEERRLRETVRWEAGEGEAWGELDSSLSYELELAFHGKMRSYSYSHKGETYSVDLSSMQRTDGKGAISRVKRTLRADADTAVIQPPPSWSKMGSKDQAIVDLVSNTQEYQEVEKEFLSTCKHPNAKTQPTIKVVQIKRIQSRSQWQRYAVKKQALDKKYPNQKNEMNLYHGTTKDICQKINTNGFNRSFCGRNATVYGDGTYFAKDTWYSCQDAYSSPDASGLKYLYRARVLVGKPCQGRRGIKEPDPLNPGDPGSDLHDCAVDNLQQPGIYVVFCDAGAYPDYLISFKTA